MKHILKEYKKDDYIYVDKAINRVEAAAGDIVEIHTIDGSVLHKVLITGKCEECSQYNLDDFISNGCLSTDFGDVDACPTAGTNFVFKDIDNILEDL